MARQFRFIWRVDPRQHLVRVCVLEDLVTAFKLSLGLHRALWRWQPQWDGFFLTALGVRVHYRRSHLLRGSPSTEEREP